MNKLIRLEKEFHSDQYGLYCLSLGLPWFSLLIFIYMNFGIVWFFYMMLLLFTLIDIMATRTRMQLELWWILTVSTTIIFAPIISIYSTGIQQKIEYIFYIFIISVINQMCIKCAIDYEYRKKRSIYRKNLNQNHDNDDDNYIQVMPVDNDLEQNGGNV
jgi:hypothetical protein